MTARPLRTRCPVAFGSAALLAATLGLGTAAPAHADGPSLPLTTLHVWGSHVNVRTWDSAAGTVGPNNGTVVGTVDAGDLTTEGQTLGEEVGYAGYSNNRWAWINIPGTGTWGWISGVFVSGGPNGDSDILDVNGHPLPFIYGP